MGFKHFFKRFGFAIKQVHSDALTTFCSHLLFTGKQEPLWVEQAVILCRSDLLSEAQASPSIHPYFLNDKGLPPLLRKSPEQKMPHLLPN